MNRHVALSTVLLCMLSVLLVVSIPQNAQARANPHIIIAFDDVGNDNSVWFSAYPIMEAFGFKGVAFCLVASCNRSDAIAELNILYNSGWEIGSHTWWHEDLTQTSMKWLLVEIRDSKAWLEQNIPGARINVLGYPHSDTNSTVISVVSKYYGLARTSSWWWWQSSVWDGKPSYTIPSITIADANYQYNMPNALRMAKSSGQTVVLLFHTINDTNVDGCGLTLSHFITCLEQIEASNIPVTTFSLLPNLPTRYDPGRPLQPTLPMVPVFLSSGSFSARGFSRTSD